MYVISVGWLGENRERRNTVDSAKVYNNNKNRKRFWIKLLGMLEKADKQTSVKTAF